MQRLSKLEVKERAKEARKHGGKATPEQKADRLPETSSDKRSKKKPKKPKTDTRAAVAKEAKIQWNGSCEPSQPKKEGD